MTATLTAAARDRVAQTLDQAVALSHRLAANPELGFEEVQACGWVADLLRDNDFDVETGVAGLDTALSASFGSGPLQLAICAEYDALPDIGHACGHNIIAASAVSAALALAPIADDLGITVRLLGTPAEENGGGKITMLERGAFDGVHAAMMVHPAPEEHADPPTLAISHLEVAYTGREAHASANPWDGINAADALVVAQTAIGLLRQHLRHDDRVHGIVTRGGEAPNIVPGHTQAAYYARSTTIKRLAELEPRLRSCFEAGALATGCSLSITQGCPTYSEAAYDSELLQFYAAAAGDLGREVPVAVTDEDRRTAGSTDMANISLAIPSIQPLIAIDAGGANNHHPDFAAACVTPSADRAVHDGGLLMALTAIHAATNTVVRQRLLTAGGRTV